jgi:ribosomal-protein-alanine N-acetyltransferase
VSEVEATPAHADVLAAIHAACFPDESWSADAMRSVLAIPGTFGALAPGGDEPPAGMILARVAADECEILTLGVLPETRRAGIARRLLAGTLKRAAAAGARKVFLEVAEDNAPALALYAAMGFAAIGRRPDYYRGSRGRRAALTLRRLLRFPAGSTSSFE